jgi:hypothetical protein
MQCFHTIFWQVLSLCWWRSIDTTNNILIEFAIDLIQHFITLNMKYFFS